MIATKWPKLFQLVAILTVYNCQAERYIKPDKCPQEECCSYPPSDCMTLSEYALNTSYYNNVDLILSSGEYYLNSTFLINNVQSFSIVGSGLESTKIICIQNATFNISNMSTMTIKNVSFVLCGQDTVPGVSLTNINDTNLVDTSFSNSTSGALDIQNCRFVRLINLKIVNNLNSQNTIVFLNNLIHIELKGLLVANNSIGTLDSTCACKNFSLANEVIFKTINSDIKSTDIQVADNTGPFGVIAFWHCSGVTVTGNWMIERNNVCFNGSLAFIKTNVEFNGNLCFVENKGISDTVQHTAGLFQQESVLNMKGLVEFTGNEGYTACILSITATLSITDGDLIIQNTSSSSYQTVVIQRESTWIINGSLNVRDNQLCQRVILIESSKINVTGQINFTNNSVSPFAIYNSEVMLQDNLFFLNNAGILYASKSKIIIIGDSTFINNSIEDDFSDGTLTVVELTTLFMDGTYEFRDNVYDDENGGGIFASIASTVRLGGTGIFSNNIANNGGGIFIDQRSSLELDKGTRLYFINNTATKGAAIFISTSVHHAQCQSNETGCLFKLEDSTNVTLTFQNNTAYPGASVIHANFDHIKERNIKYPALIDLTSVANESSLISGNSLPLYASDTYWFCFCQNNSRKSCMRDDKPKNISAFKGKPFSVGARVLKFYGSNMSEPVRANLESSLSAVDRGKSMVNASLTANNGRILSVEATKCSNFNFSVKSTADHETIIMNVAETFLDAEKSLKINVSFSSSCPPGFPLNDNKDSCECDESIKRYLLSCEITDETFTKRIEHINYWMAPSTNTAKMSWYSSCPNRYCITNEEFTFSDDGICANNRSGVLCGKCKEGYSLLLGGDLCGDCSDNSYLALILVFAAAGVLLIAFIFLIQITVTTGTINGLIFYANILNSNQSLFFPEGFFPGYRIFISWLNLNFGIETCFLFGMNQLVYSGLQFLFPLYLWLLAGIILILCHFSMRVAKFFGSSDPVAVLATIILLSFNSLTQNVIDIFYYSSINHPDDGNPMLVWRYDGNIKFASDINHFILLVIASAFFLFLLTPYTLVLLSAPFLQKSERISKIFHKLKIQPFIHSYLIPFKPHHRYWVGLCLFMRAILLIIFAFGENQQLNLLLIITACVIAISMFSFTGGIYDKSWIDKLEMLFLINLGVLAAATLYSLNFSINGQGEIATYISITVALLTFIGIVLLHFFWRLKKFKVVNKAFQPIVKKLKSFKKQKLDKNKSPRKDDEDNISINTIGTPTTTTCQVDLREPLLESMLN